MNVARFLDGLFHPQRAHLAIDCDSQTGTEIVADAQTAAHARVLRFQRNDDIADRLRGDVDFSHISRQRSSQRRQMN